MAGDFGRISSASCLFIYVDGHTPAMVYHNRVSAEMLYCPEHEGMMWSNDCPRFKNIGWDRICDGEL
jgi:hypothetical protein